MLSTHNEFKNSPRYTRPRKEGKREGKKEGGGGGKKKEVRPAGEQTDWRDFKTALVVLFQRTQV